MRELPPPPKHTYYTGRTLHNIIIGITRAHGDRHISQQRDIWCGALPLRIIMPDLLTRHFSPEQVEIATTQTDVWVTRRNDSYDPNFPKETQSIVAFGVERLENPGTTQSRLLRLQYQSALQKNNSVLYQRFLTGEIPDKPKHSYKELPPLQPVADPRRDAAMSNTMPTFMAHNGGLGEIYTGFRDVEPLEIDALVMLLRGVQKALGPGNGP